MPGWPTHPHVLLSCTGYTCDTVLSRAMVPRSLLGACALLAAATTAYGALPGQTLVAEVFVGPQDVTLGDFPEFQQLTPDLEMGVQTVSFHKADFSAIEVGGVPLTKNFGMRIHGSLWVATAGNHTFSLTSDDGSLLMLDGEQVIDNGEWHTELMRKITLELTQGWHVIEVHYFQAGLGAELRLEWATPTTARAVIPASSYGPPVTTAPAPATPAPATAPPAQTLVAEVIVQRYDVTIGDFPQFHLLTPDLVMDVQTVNFTQANFSAIEVGGVPLTENFGMRIHGSLWVATAGNHTFSLTSDDGSLLMLDGEQVIDNGEWHTEFMREITLELTQGWHVIEVHYFQAGLGAELRLEWATPTTARAVIPASSYGPPVTTAPAPATPAPATAPLVQTLVAEVFVLPQDVPIWDFPEFQLLTPDLVMDVHNVSFQEADFATIEVGGVPLTKNFGMRIHGSLWVATAGNHTFSLTSDDGSLLMLDGKQVIDNGKLHLARSREVTLELTQGWHAIKVHYFQGGFGAGLWLEWTTPTTPRAIIPASSYGPPVTTAPATMAPATPSPPTPAPATPAPATTAPATPSPPASTPATPAPATLAPSTHAPTTTAPVTPSPPTRAPATPAPGTPAPATPAPATPAPATKAPATPSPQTPAPRTPSPPTTALPTPVPPTPSPPTPASPCPVPEIVASFATSSEFNETAPLTFRGEVYMRATVIINAYTDDGSILEFDSTSTPGKPCTFTVMQDGVTGRLVYIGYTEMGHYSVLEGPTQVPVGRAFLFELTITRDNTVSGDRTDALAIMYIDSVEYARGPVALPTRVMRDSNYIGHSHIAQHAPLDGTVSDFRISESVPTLVAALVPDPGRTSDAADDSVPVVQVILFCLLLAGMLGAVAYLWCRRRNCVATAAPQIRHSTHLSTHLPR